VGLPMTKINIRRLLTGLGLLVILLLLEIFRNDLPGAPQGEQAQNESSYYSIKW